MEHNLSLGPEAQANHALAVLRHEARTEEIANEERFLPGLWFSFDPNAEVAGTLISPGGELGTVRVSAKRTPRWLALHIALGGLDLRPHAAAGLICRTQAPRAVTLRPCLRSGTEDGFLDCFFAKHVVAYGEKSTHMDLVDLARTGEIPPTAPWRDFILFFQEDMAELRLIDLRLFIV